VDFRVCGALCFATGWPLDCGFDEARAADRNCWERNVTFSPLLVYILVLLGFVVTNLLLAHIAGPRKSTIVKEMPYESGMDPVGDARQPFDVKFYVVAILFLVFDVELLFLYPWAVTAYANAGLPAELRGTVFAVMLVFMATLVIAYLYAWRKGVFRWR
jgi:NADH-quinone oxidoreductase subunit A